MTMVSFDVVLLLTKVPTDVATWVASTTKSGSITTRAVGIIAWWVCQSPQVLPGCNILMIQRRGVPAGLWYGNGLPHLCHYGQSGYGRCGAKGTQHPCIPTCILEMLLGRHLHGVTQRAGPTVSWPLQLSWTDYQVHNRDGTGGITPIPRHQSDSQQWWFTDHHSLHTEDPLRLVPRLWLPPSSSTQCGSGSDTATLGQTGPAHVSQTGLLRRDGSLKPSVATVILLHW